MASILFYAGDDDNAALKKKIKSLGLRIYKGEFEKPGLLGEVAADAYHGFVSFQDPSELHPYPGRDHDFPYRITTVTDPLIMWIRKSWPPPAKGRVCRGPQAQRMIQFESYISRGLPPDIEIQYVET